MNLYARLAFGHDGLKLSELAARLAAWHDAMVGHERRLRTGRTDDVCDDECPHADAPALWTEAVAAFGERSDELAFLRSRATMGRDQRRRPFTSPWVPAPQTTAEAEL